MTFGGGSYGTIILNNTTAKFAATGQKITTQNLILTWQNTGQVLVSGSSVPAAFLASTTVAGPMVLEALDLS